MTMDEFLNALVLSALEKDQNVGYMQRQSIPEDDLIKIIMQRYNLGPTGLRDATVYARDLRTFENAKEFEPR